MTRFAFLAPALPVRACRAAGRCGDGRLAAFAFYGKEL